MELAGSGHSAQHDPYHCDLDPRRDALGQALTDADYATALHQPAEGPFDYPKGMSLVRAVQLHSQEALQVDGDGPERLLKSRPESPYRDRMDKPNSDVLIHWTGRNSREDGTEEKAFEILRTICSERLLRLTYCPEYVRDKLQREVAMVCFTDIPLSESFEHCNRFGNCGIAFDKESFTAYGANPVFYTTNSHFNRIVEVSTLLEKMMDLEKDREWMSKLNPFSFSENQTVALIEILSFLQDYCYKGKKDPSAINYTQREWRITFKTLPFAANGEPQKPGMSSFYIRDTICYRNMAFADSDVRYVVVPRKFVDNARSIAKDLKCEIRIFEDEVYSE